MAAQDLLDIAKTTLAAYNLGEGLPGAKVPGTIGKGNIAAAPGHPLGTHGQPTWLHFQVSHPAGVIDPGTGRRGVLYQGITQLLPLEVGVCLGTARSG